MKKLIEALKHTLEFDLFSLMHFGRRRFRIALCTIVAGYWVRSLFWLMISPTMCHFGLFYINIINYDKFEKKTKPDA